MSLPPLLKNKFFKVLIVIGLILLIVRLALPSVVEKYVNKTLAELPGYQGKVEDIDIALIRGAYVIKELNLKKLEAQSYVPFVKIEKADISIEWRSLFRGRIVSEIELSSPELIYIAEDHREDIKPEKDDWTEALTDLVPISINSLKVHDGKFAFVQIIPDPNIDLSVNDVYLEATNLQNVKESEIKLPSRILAEGKSIGNGALKVEGKMNMLKEIPDTDIAISLENADVTALNDILNHYANLQYVNGTFDFYSEVAISDGYMESYIKPLFQNTEIESENENLLGKIKEGVADFFQTITKNDETQNVATKIPISGDLKNTEIGVWCGIINLFKNAWIKALENNIDGTIEFEDAQKG